MHVPLVMVICTTGAQYDSCPLGNGDKMNGSSGFSYIAVCNCDWQCI